MGVTWRVASFKKEKSCITGHIQCLGWYEVDLEKSSAYQLSKDWIDFRYGIHSIDEVFSNYTGWGFYDVNEFDFYHHTTDYMNGNNLRMENGHTYGVMFEPHPILLTINKLLKIVDDLTNENIAFYDEKTNLIRFKQLLEHAIEQDGIISCVVS
jgi:hypothetical protein